MFRMTFDYVIAKARAFAPQIPAKWIAADGKSFWLVWSDFQGTMPDEIWTRSAGMSDQRRGVQRRPAHRASLTPIVSKPQNNCWSGSRRK